MTSTWPFVNGQRTPVQAGATMTEAAYEKGVRGYLPDGTAVITDANTGDVTLGGVLNASLVNDYVPLAGELERLKKLQDEELQRLDKIKRVEDPLTEGYDSHVLKLHDRASALVLEWADVIGYAGYRTFVTKVDAGFGQKETKATTTGERLLHVEAHPAHCGGNRFGLKNMPLDWAAFSAALAAIQTAA